MLDKHSLYAKTEKFTGVESQSIETSACFHFIHLPATFLSNVKDFCTEEPNHISCSPSHAESIGYCNYFSFSATTTAVVDVFWGQERMEGFIMQKGAGKGAKSVHVWPHFGIRPFSTLDSCPSPVILQTLTQDRELTCLFAINCYPTESVKYLKSNLRRV